MLIRIDFVSKVDSNLKSEFICFLLQDFYTQMYCSTQFKECITNGMAFIALELDLEEEKKNADFPRCS